MDKLGRRKFVKNLLLASGLLILPESIIKASKLKNNQSQYSDNTAVDVDLQTAAKEFFYKKEYTNAEIVFRQLINNQPNDIEGYDGLAKVYWAQQKLIAVFQLRTTGLNTNPDHILFAERYAKTLMRIATGHKTIARTVATEINTESLFETAILLYCNSIEKAPQKTHLRFGLLDAIYDLDVYNKLQKENNQLTEALQLKVKNLTDEYVNTWRENRTPRKSSSRMGVRSTLATQEEARRTLYFENERNERSSSILKYKQKQQIEYFDLTHPKEGVKPRSIYVPTQKITLITGPLIERIRDHAKRSKNYNELYQVTKVNYQDSTRFWNTIAYADALRQKKEYPDLAISLYQQAEKKLPTTLQFKKISAVYCGWAKCLFENGDYASGREKLLTALDLMNGVSGNALHLIIHYANSYWLENKPEQTEQILVALSRKHELTNWESNLIDPVCKFIFPNPDTDRKILFMQQIQSREMSKATLLPLCLSIAKLYKAINNTSRLTEICLKIKEIDTEGPHVYQFENIV